MDETLARTRFVKLVRWMQGLLTYDTNDIRARIARTFSGDPLLLWMSWSPDERELDFFLPINADTKELFEAGITLLELSNQSDADDMREYAYQRIFGQPLH